MIINKYYLDELQKIYSESKVEEQNKRSVIQPISNAEWWNLRGFVQNLAVEDKLRSLLSIQKSKEKKHK